MASTSTSTFLAQYGIAESSLSGDVKDGINEVLRAATKEGLQQLGQILQKEAQKRGINTGGAVDAAAQDEAARIAKEEYDAQQAAAKKKQQRTILMGVAGGILLISIIVAVLMTRKKKSA